MKLEGKKVLVAGLAVSGVASVKALADLGASVLVTDMKKREELEREIESLSDVKVEYVLGSNEVDLESIDLILKSPGIPFDIPILNKARERKIEILTDIELAYRVASADFICVTGTNGKTTTTSLIGEIFKKAGKRVFVVGNIGVGILSKLSELQSSENVFIIEASSFQLQDTSSFKPRISLITNITPDHLNWHKEFDHYVDAKKKIFANQDSGDYAVLNFEDEILRSLKDEVKSNLIYFSSKTLLDEGLSLKDDIIVYRESGTEKEILKTSDIKIPGSHNLENILSAVAVALSYGIEPDTIRKAVSEFEGVEHRLEFVRSLNRVSFYNDSKGTNCDASIKAVEAVETPIVLIAGGMDKGGSFEELAVSFKDRVKSLVLLGETAEKIKAEAEAQGLSDIYLVSGIEEAAEKAYEISKPGDTVLLSPACASWDMYPSYEVRGRLFKEAVNSLKE